MGDLFLHLPFARRLRFAEGLHPIAAEAMVRRAPAVILGASLPFLPEIERKGASWFRRLFMGGGQEAAKWRKYLENRDGPPRSEFILGLLSAEGDHGPGPMTRLAFGIGALSTEVLSSTTDSVLSGLEGSTRTATEIAIARLWIQKSIPNLGGLQSEWRPAMRLNEGENLKPLLNHLEKAMKTAFGEAPSREVLQRWVKGLTSEVAPILHTGGLPAETSIPLHEVDSKYFAGDHKFIERSQEALTRAVYLANRVAECFLGQDATRQQLSDALCEKPGTLRDIPSNDVLDGIAVKWKSRVADVREDALHRGRNPEAAFREEDDDLLDGLPDLPPLPPDASGQNPVAPASPNVTQEVSLSQIESEVGKAAAEVGITPRAPANTQQVSVADIEAEVDAQSATPPAAPATTQQISAVDIEAELSSTDAESTGAAAPPPAPTTTQQISAVDIEAELSSTDPAPAATPPAAPTTTQQISAVDIQAELAAESAAVPPPRPSGFAAPAHTQQVSLADIEAEVASAAAPPIPSGEDEPVPPPLPESALPPGTPAPPSPDGFSKHPTTDAPTELVSADLMSAESETDDGADSAVAESADGAVADSAVADSAVADSAVADSAVADSAVADSAVADSAVADSAVADSAVADSAVADSAVADSAVADSAVADSAVADSAVADGAVPTSDGVNAGAANVGDAAPEAAASNGTLPNGASGHAQEPAHDVDAKSDDAAEASAEEDADADAQEEVSGETAAATTKKEIRPLPGPSN